VRAVLAGVLLALALAPAAPASERQPTQAELEGELVCPTCHTTLDQSNAPVALRMKAFVRERIAAGDTKSEIKEQLVAQFGKGVLAAPETEGFDLLAWVLPLAGLLAGGAVLSFLLWRWTRRPEDELPLLE
jgi:cytochrome c-type biogenesis protein CcmH